MREGGGVETGCETYASAVPGPSLLLLVAQQENYHDDQEVWEIRGMRGVFVQAAACVCVGHADALSISSIRSDAGVSTVEGGPPPQLLLRLQLLQPTQSPQPCSMTGRASPSTPLELR